MLFAFIEFWWAVIAVGGAAMSIPVVIHLLNRRRYQIVTWAAMRFLLNAQKQSVRRMRLEQLLLLLMRMALVALLLLAMVSVTGWAEEIWSFVGLRGSEFWRQGPGRTHKILVLDASLSMEIWHKDKKKTSFELARDKALEIIRKSQAGDAFSVCLMKGGGRTEWIVGKVSTNSRAVTAVVKNAKSAHGNADVLTVLKETAEKLAESPPRFTARQVYFLTDLQSATWLTAHRSKTGDQFDPALVKVHLQQIEKQARTVFVDVGKTGANNLAVTDLTLNHPWVATGMTVSVIATIRHFGARIYQDDFSAELLIGRARAKQTDAPFKMMKVQQTIPFSIKPGESQPIVLKHAFSQPGTYAVQVRIPSDDLRADNRRTIIVTVKDTIPVLVIDGKPAADYFDRASPYLQFALQPFPQHKIPLWAPLRPKVITARQFASNNELNLAEYDCVFLCDVGNLAGWQVRHLETHLRRGGGLVIGMGERAGEQIDAYNKLLYQRGRELLPGRLLRVQQAPSKYFFSPQAENDEAFTIPPLKAFDNSEFQSGLWNVRTRRYVRVEPNGNARKILLLTPAQQPDADVSKGKDLPIGDPLLMEWNPQMPKKTRKKPALIKRPKLEERPRYRGKVALITTSLNMDWTSWPGSPSYGAMMQELTRLAVSGRLRANFSPVGAMLEEYLISNGTKFSVKLHLPNNAATRTLETIGQGDVTTFRWPHTDNAGIYRMTVGQDLRDYLFAVNPPAHVPHHQASESDPAKASEALLKEAYPKWNLQIVDDLSQVNLAAPTSDAPRELVERKAGPQLAYILASGVLALLILEVILAWVFGRFTSVPGATGKTHGGFVWPTLTALATGGFFLIFAVVLAQAVITGDFLSFLPPSLRSWMEARAGVAAPPSGEGRLWEPDFRPPFFDFTTYFWLAGIGLAVTAAVLFCVYLLEGHRLSILYKMVLLGVRLFLIFVCLFVILDQFQVNLKRQSWPDVVVLIDDSLSMGESDQYKDEEILKRVAELRVQIKKQLQEQLPKKITELRSAIGVKVAGVDPKAVDDLPQEVIDLKKKLAQLESLQTQLDSEGWKPNRLQLAQATLKNGRQDWFKSLLEDRRMKVHIYHLNAIGQALKITDAKGNPIALTELKNQEQMKKARNAVAALEPYATESQLGTAVRQVLDHFGGSSVSALIFLTDGITTAADGKSKYEKNLEQVAKYAVMKNVPLFLVGIGDDHEMRDLRLHDLQVIDTAYVGDRIIFEARLTGRGFKNLTVPVLLKIREKDGTETEIARQLVKVDPRGKPVRVQLKHQAKKPGEKLFIVEAVPPKLDDEDQEKEYSNLRLQRSVLVQKAEPIKVLYVEGSSRYEYRFIKAFLERERKEEGRKRSIKLKTLLLDSDPDFAAQDKTAISEFPFNKVELFRYDVILLGDVDPHSAKLGEQKLQNLADFVRVKGGGLLMIAGSIHSPHAWRKTPLAGVLPIDPDRVPPVEPLDRPDGYQIELTPVGNLHPIFRFSPNHAENLDIWRNLAPMYWWSEGYKLKPAAEVLAVHPKVKRRDKKGPGRDTRHPLVVQHFVGAGRCMFFGFDSSWRWGFRGDEVRFNQFWLQTVRYLSPRRQSQTKLLLDRQTPYRQGEKMKVTVRFPDNMPVPNPEQKAGEGRKNVKVMIRFQPIGPDGKPGEAIPDSMDLVKVEGSWASYEGYYPAAQKGKYLFWLSDPDVSSLQPNKKKPSAEAVVVLPPGELDRLRMNREEMEKAAEISGGQFYTLATADQLTSELPPGFRVLLGNEADPWVLWNHWLLYLLILGLLTAEWVLRKRQHLL